MSKKLICLSVALLLAAPAIAGADGKGPVGWWKFDETSGTVAADSSGSGLNGTLLPAGGGPTWVAGKLGGALKFNGSTDSVDLGNQATFNPSGSFTVTLWANIGAWSNEWACVMMGNRGEDNVGWQIRRHANWNGGRLVFTTRGVGNDDMGSNRTSTSIPLNEWMHIGCTYNADAKTKAIYFNGLLDISGATTTGGAIAATTHNTYIGARANGGNTGPESFFTGMLDDVRFYNRVLTGDDVASAMSGGMGYGAASTPAPANKATDVLRDQILSWTAGPEAVSHDVYFGTDPANLQKVGAGQTTTTFNPGRMEFGKSYYWRVDEIGADGTLYTGNPWSFTAELLAYKVTSVTPTASSYVAGSEPNKTVGGLGLDANDLHGIDQKTMWVSDPKAEGLASIQYAFDKPYKLYEMWVWNANTDTEGDMGYGFYNTTVEYSNDGVTWTKLGDYVFEQGISAEGYAHNTTIGFNGVTAKMVKLTAADNWGGIVNKFSLSEVRFYYFPAAAGTPTPANNATGQRPDVTMTWRPGRSVATHDVYLGTDPNSLELAGSVPASGVTASFNPTTLQLDSSVYYWRVDEVNNAEVSPVITGDVWKFTTASYLTVDDMESYTNDIAGGKTIYQTWLDGYTSSTNGAQVGNDIAPFAATDVVVGGSQSMPLRYTNTASEPISEATRTFTAAQNWTIGGIKTLVLFVRADAGNTGNGKLYVKINNVQVDYAGTLPTSPAPVWVQWNIDLTNVSGLTSVNSLTVGISGVGASGKLYVDNIRLYKTAVDATPKDPGTANLVSYIDMEGGKVADSISGITAVNLNSTTFEDSLAGFGKALKCAGGTTAETTQFVDLGATYWDQVVSKLSNCTFSVWTNYTGLGNIWQRVFDFGCGTNVNTYISSSGATMGIGQFAVKTNVANAGSTGTGYVEVLVRSAKMSVGWHHLAGVVDNSGAYPTISIYLDGALSGGPVAGRLPKDMTLQASPGAWQNYFGKSNWPDPYLNGSVDEFRVYDRTLTPGEVNYLAGGR